MDNIKGLCEILFSFDLKYYAGGDNFNICLFINYIYLHKMKILEAAG